jgi:hypothetical protein
MVATYASTIRRAQSRYFSDCASSAKPSLIQPRTSSAPAASDVRRARGSRHQPAKALWTLAPRLLCAQGAPFFGIGRSR